jgi:hypothetical protein
MKVPYGASKLVPAGGAFTTQVEDSAVRQAELSWGSSEPSNCIDHLLRQFVNGGRCADLVIHDAQYTRDEFAMKADWGHCTPEYAVWLAVEAGAKCVALFHHDPTHDDDAVDRILHDVRAARSADIEIIAAHEGLALHIGE